MKKKTKLLLILIFLILVGVIVFVVIGNRAEAPTGENIQTQFKGPAGTPSVKGPTTSPPGF
jgi:hypothetical protein